MLMVIFGAGASYDSSPDFPPPQPQAAKSNLDPPPASPDPREAWRPPLANQLFLDPHGAFGDVVKAYHKLRPIMDSLRRPSSGRSVEEVLQFLLVEADGDPERIRQLFSVRYYLHDLFLRITQKWLERTDRISNYGRLLDQIRHLNRASEPVCLVTFNYDLLLDDALVSFDYKKPQDVRLQPNAHPIFKLLKPHGSADWARLLTTSPTRSRLQPEQLIEHAHEIQPSDNYVTANATDPHEMFNFPAPIVPAIAIPVQTKTEDTFEWPAIHRDFFLTLLPSVTQILIIGWRGKEAHFLNLLRENLPKGGLTQIRHLEVVGADSAEVENISKQFLADIDRRVWKLPALHAQGFTDFVRQEQVGFFFKD
jgi:hypothetical protein